MFREIIQALRKQNTLSEMVSQFGEMLEIGHGIFKQGIKVATHDFPADNCRDELFKRDRQINTIERAIREKIVTHLATDHDGDIGLCLVLMSVVKDAERIGDYCKNLFEIGDQFKGTYKQAEFTVPLGDLAIKIDNLFPQVQETFAAEEKELSRTAVDESVLIRSQCDLMLKQLLTPGGITQPDEAAALALRTRYIKRIAAHLGNIATSVGNPIPMLDYQGKKPLDEPS
ncbi:MAG TPA: hypothetical protein ENL03_05840 [Phycisphaerae bacterium]|nr:hypothetical protein [Phycisphaerae bacterium]